MAYTKFILPISGIIFSIIIIYLLFPSSHPYGGVYVPESQNELEMKAKQLLASLDLNTDELYMTSTIEMNKELHRHLQSELGLRKSNTLMRTTYPVYYRVLSWYRERPAFDITSGEIEENPAPIISIKFGQSGSLIQFVQDIHDTISPVFIPLSEARAKAETFIKKWSFIDISKFDVIEEDTTGQDVSGYHEFRFKKHISEHNLKNIISINYSGDIVTSYVVDYDTPLSYDASGIELLSSLTTIIPFIIISIVIIVASIKRIRNREIGFRYGLFLGGIIALTIIITFPQLIRGNFDWLTILPYIFLLTIIIIIYAFAWGVSESIVRATWRDKLFTIDLLASGHFLHSRVSSSILTGGTVGIYLFAASIIVFGGVDTVFPLQTFISPINFLDILHTSLPAIIVISMALLLSLFLLIPIVVALSLFKQRLNSGIMTVISAGIILGLIQWHVFAVSPILLGFLISTAIAIGIVWVLYRYDILAVFCVVFVIALLDQIPILFHSGDPMLIQHGTMIVVLIVGIGMVSISSQLRKETVNDFEALSPTYYHYITERERLQRELEVARKVQMSFLPKKHPDIKQLDVAARCIPAGEVEVLQPNGLALGLENGPIFNKTIEETKISMHTNDIVLLYTDGLTEAINPRKVEFGTDRLIESLKRNGTSGSADIIEGIFQDIYSFAGRVPPVDDMTMVVVKMG